MRLAGAAAAALCDLAATAAGRAALGASEHTVITALLRAAEAALQTKGSHQVLLLGTQYIDLHQTRT